MPFVPAEWHGKLGIMALMTYAGEPDGGRPVLAPFRALAEPIADMLRPDALRRDVPARGPELPPDRDVAHVLHGRRGPGDGATHRRPAPGAHDGHGPDDGRGPAPGAGWRGRAGARRRHRLRPPRRPDHGQCRGPGHDADDLPAHVPWVESLVDDLRGDDPRAYVNFLADEGPERVHAAYPGATWDRLVAIKRRYDPDNLFHRNQNVPPA